jgi:hypothetical protein
MPLFSYNRDIPDGPNNPSVDQPKMKINTNSTDDLIDVDHFSFDEANGGYHRQVTIATKNTPAAQTDPSSAIFTAQASTLPGAIATNSATTVAQEFYKNANGIFPSSAIRAFGDFLVTTGPLTVTLRNCFNIASVTSNANRTIFTINMISGATNGTNYIFIPFTTDIAISTSMSVVKAVDTITVTMLPGPNAGIFNFIVLQV